MKNVTFYLGPAVGLAARRLVIRRFNRGGDDYDLPAATSMQTLAGTAESATVELSDNTLYQATLKDYKTTGEESRIDVLNFHTGSLQFPGPKSGDRLAIYSMEDLSSSSSVSSSSSSVSSVSTSSSSSSHSSSSASSLSSLSSSSSVSTSSISTSSSSVSTSSSSASSVSTSSSSESSASSASSSSSSESSASSESSSSVSTSSASSSSGM